MLARDWHSHWQAVDVGEAQGPRDERAAMIQVGKTTMGKPVPRAQLHMLADHIRRTLQLEPSHRCLDLGCGNGLLTTELSPHVAEVVAIDYSRPLLRVAREQFATPNTRYVCRDLTDLGADWVPAGQFARGWSAEVMQHLSPEGAAGLLGWLGRHLAEGGRVLLSGIPERERLRAFYNTEERYARYQRMREAGVEQIGTWWQADELTRLATKHGLVGSRVSQPTGLYTAHYRFDFLLERPH